MEILVQDPRSVEPVEFRRRCRAVCADVFRNEVVPHLKVPWQLHRKRDLVETVTRRSHHRTYLPVTLLERMEVGNPMVVYHTGECMVDTVVDMVEHLPIPPRFANDL